MKRLLLPLIASGLFIAMAGELAVLHNVLAAPDATSQECNATPPAGVTFAPGFDPCAPTPATPAISEIGIERTNCLTNCPVYTFIVQADGRFRYNGIANVERLGEHTGTVEVGRLQQVLRYAEAIGFMSLQDTYQNSSLDNPATYTMVTLNGETKVILNYANTAPPTVWALEQLLEGLLEDASWD